ncbi:conserved hypothetical protein [Ricinus communis]|uniref:Uncharacterized protein n=1 Tax=Ricinus communis TaxID=3988 RepID=B9SNK4_RICCO|nr:conserved hypothetical protein [Ricinus communis]
MIRKYLVKCQFIIEQIENSGGSYMIEKIPREENEEADALAKLKTEEGDLFQSLEMIKKLYNPNIEQPDVLVVEEGVE